jgi:DNA polymerase III alpha subunit (gram-positive type)
MNNSKFFLFDCETGGLDENTTNLLSVYGMILDNDLNIIDTISLFLEPEDKVYHLDIHAMKINKINILEHTKIALSNRVCASRLHHFLETYTIQRNQTLVATGHNLDLDVRFLKKLLKDFPEGNRVWEEYFSSRRLDSAVIANYKKLIGVFSEEQNCSLHGLAKRYGIDFPIENQHTAKEDSEVTRLVLKAMIAEDLPKKIG